MKAMQMVLNDIETDSPIHIQPARQMSDEEFYAFCAANPDLRIERTAEGEIAIMPPTGFETSNRNMDLSAQLQAWAKRNGRGKALDSNLVHKFGRKCVKDFEEFIRELKAQPSQAVGDIFVFVDECHRTQSGKLHDVMEAILPTAIFHRLHRHAPAQGRQADHPGSLRPLHPHL